LHGSLTTHCSAFGVCVPIHDLSAYHKILLSIKFPIKISSKIWPLSIKLLTQKLGDLQFDQVIPMLLLVSYILAQYTKI
jgi:hypothetical protein